MAVLMGVVMATAMLAFTQAMYKNRMANVGSLGGSEPPKAVTMRANVEHGRERDSVINNALRPRVARL